MNIALGFLCIVRLLLRVRTHSGVFCPLEWAEKIRWATIKRNLNLFPKRNWPSTLIITVHNHSSNIYLLRNYVVAKPSN